MEAAPPAAGKTKRKPSKRYEARPEAQEMPACKAAGQQGARTKARVTQRKGTGVRDAPVHLADPLGMVKVPCRRRSGAVPHLLKVPVWLALQSLCPKYMHMHSWTGLRLSAHGVQKGS